MHPNQCLAWLRLSMDDRETVLEKNTIKCKICLRHFGVGENRGDVCKRKHIENTDRNGSCWKRGCDYNVTMCRDHYNINPIPRGEGHICPPYHISTIFSGYTYRRRLQLYSKFKFCNYLTPKIGLVSEKVFFGP